MLSERQEIDKELLILELETILEETVNEALNEQYLDFKKRFAKESEKLSVSRNFWRKAAIIEGAAIIGMVVYGGFVWKMNN